MRSVSQNLICSWFRIDANVDWRLRKVFSRSVLWLLLLFAAVDSGVAHTGVKSQPQLNRQQVIEAEQLLWNLGYWGGPIDGKFDSTSRHALIAFQKVEGRARSGNLTETEFRALQSASRPAPRDTGSPHIEIDLRRQVLLMVDATGTVMRVLPVSTGNGARYIDHGEVHYATTPRGTFKVMRKVEGWRVSSLGLLYYPNYILSGFAIHGSLSVPAHPASHGCIRIPMFAAKEFSKLTPIGTPVMVYD